MRRLPLLLTLLRAALAPTIVLLALLHPAPAAFGLCLILGAVSDYFDGAIARRLKIVTPGLRRLDSLADSLFYVAALFAAVWLYPQAIMERIWPLGVLLALELLRYVFDYAKFGREASYHLWSSKLWGLTLFLGAFSLLAMESPGFLLSLALYVGILADLEGLAVSLALREWRTDVPSLLHAIQLRRGSAPTQT